MHTQTIPGYEDYRINEDGEITSFRRITPQVLKQFKNTSGYYMVKLATDEGIEQRLVHNLVLEAFVGPRPASNYQAAHNNGNKEDNRLENLTWKTVKENAADRVLHGTQVRGETHGRAKLTYKKAQEIRSLLELGYTQQEIADKYGIHRETVGKIKRNAKLWSEAA